MKTLIAAILILSACLLKGAEFDITIPQKRADGTNVSRTVAPDASGVFTFSAGKIPQSTAITSFVMQANLGANVATFLATPTIANFNAALSDADAATTGANTFTGIQTLPVGTVLLPSLTFTGDADTGIYQPFASSIGYTLDGVAMFVMDTGSGAGFLTAKSTSKLGWSSGDPSVAAMDTGLARNGAGVVEVNSGSSGAFRDIAVRSALFKGTTSGTVTVSPAAVAGTWTFQFPADDGTIGQVLVTDGSGVTSWSSTPTLTGTNFSDIPASGVTGTALTLAGGTITESIGSSALTIIGATQTSSFPALNISQTWNNAGTTFTGIKLNVTNTASAAASLLLDLQTGSTSMFKVTREGVVTIANSGGAALTVSGGTSLASGSLVVTDSATAAVKIYTTYPLTWGTTNAPMIFGDAADVVSVKNGARAQFLRVFGTTTGSKYAEITHNGTDAVISASSGTVKVTTGGLTVGTNGTAMGAIKRASATLVAGTATVTDTDTTANTVVLATVLTPLGTVGFLDFDVSAGASYTINSSNALDLSIVRITVIHFP